MKIEIICPLYNGKNYVLDLVNKIKIQKNITNYKLLFILTDTNDGTEELLKDNKLNYKKIKKENFSHSLTREEAINDSKADIIVSISQDIEIKDDMWLYNLTKDIISGKVEAAYSRQISKYNNIEKYTRERNYSDKSRIVSKDDIKELGLRTFFFSDASSAMNRNVFKKLNGYDGKKLPINEDMYYAYKLINNGYRIKYCADSVVYHSHKFSIKQLYKRYYDTGIFFAQNSFIDQFNTNKTGNDIAFYILKRIFQDKHFSLLLSYPFDMAARLIGMKKGKRRGNRELKNK